MTSGDDVVAGLIVTRTDDTLPTAANTAAFLVAAVVLPLRRGCVVGSSPDSVLESTLDSQCCCVHGSMSRAHASRCESSHALELTGATSALAVSPSPTVLVHLLVYFLYFLVLW